MNLLRTPNALNLQDFLEHFELTLLCILHSRYNSTPAENRMGDTFSLKITDKVLYIQYLYRSRYDRHGWWKCRFCRSNTPVDSTDLFRIIQNRQPQGGGFRAYMDVFMAYLELWASFYSVSVVI